MVEFQLKWLVGCWHDGDKMEKNVTRRMVTIRQPCWALCFKHEFLLFSMSGRKGALVEINTLKC